MSGAQHERDVRRLATITRKALSRDSDQIGDSNGTRFSPAETGEGETDHVGDVTNMVSTHPDDLAVIDSPPR